MYGIGYREELVLKVRYFLPCSPAKKTATKHKIKFMAQNQGR